MAQISESGPDPNAVSGALGDGLAVLPLQTIRFAAYTRAVLPLDGFVFWVPKQEYIDIIGALSYSQTMEQAEDETRGYVTVQFATREQITEFETAPPNTLYVGTVNDFRFAFSQQTGRFDPSGAWHYFGHSIQPAMASQLLDRPGSIDLNQAVTSNSLALWLGLNGYNSPFDDELSLTGVPFFVAPPTLYPSGMVPPNLIPPYGVVHIGENDTRALQSVPYIDANRSHYQLVSDRVRITLYGLQNDACLDFQDTVNKYSLLTDNFGIMNMPVVRDAIRTQAELQTRAMKKTLEYEISYNQTRVAQVARKLILSCVPTYIIAGGAQ
jgi:hypothetical protein